MVNEAFKPGWLAEEKTYIASDYHRWVGLEDRLNFFTLDNIGKNGENLTIAVLSMNRSSLTIRLLKSVCAFIPDFSGKILIGDNGSNEAELRKLELFVCTLPFECKILRFGKNYGVAGGRNRLFQAVETDWLMSLDNDLYFTSNPLEQAQRDIGTLGVHFLAMPLIDKGSENSGIYGGHLYLEPMEGHAAIGIGSSYTFQNAPRNIPMDGFLCTGVPGTAAIMNKETFFSVGGFDDGMFVGFEDTEFSVRVFQKGFKVGCCGMISLEHDHPKAENKDDKAYEQKRFSNVKILEAARYFEQKHGFLVWNQAVAKWVFMRQRETHGNEDLDPNQERVKIAIVIDKLNWALDHVADHIIKNLSDEFDFIRIYGIDVDNFTDVLMLAKDCQIIHTLWRGHLATFCQPYCQQRILNLGMTREQFYEEFLKGKVISTEVYDHLLLEGPESEKTQQLFVDDNSIVTNYAVSSQKLWALYSRLPGLRIRPEAVLADGVDTECFVPQNLERLHNLSNRTVRFGWVGNSKWLVNDLKGINTIIKPAIAELQAEGYNIELITSDCQNKLIPHEEMPSFYAQLDCYLCASSCEGTPNPILEAMACGLPVITTDVGLVPELFGKEQMAYVLEERTVQCMKEKIKKLLHTDGAFKALSRENLHQIQAWDWRIMTQNFRKFFHNCLLEMAEKQRSGEQE